MKHRARLEKRKALARYRKAWWEPMWPREPKTLLRPKLVVPHLVIVPRSKTMPETVAEEMPDAAAIAANRWLPDRELAFYSADMAAPASRAGLQWYRCGTSGAFNAELQTWSGRTIDVPSCFISGKQDWGTFQRPGVFELMPSNACTTMIGCHLVDGAGHWVQQEQPEQVSHLLLQFVKQLGKATAG